MKYNIISDITSGYLIEEKYQPFPLLEREDKNNRILDNKPLKTGRR
jgi:hypothetical protein